MDREGHPCRCRLAEPLLAFSFFAGLLMGVTLFLGVNAAQLSLMRGSGNGSVSIVLLFVTNCLPFLISAYAVYLSKAWLLFPVAFLRGCLFAFAAMGTGSCFGSAGWLFRPLFLFSDTLSLPVLYLFWLRHISGDHKFDFGEIVLYLAIVLLTGSIDYCLISPFLAPIISF